MPQTQARCKAQRRVLSLGIALAALVATAIAAGPETAGGEPAATSLERVLPSGLDALPTPAKLPAETFGRLPFIESPRLSPNGNRVAARLNVAGKVMLGIRFLQEKDRKAIYIPLEKNFELLWYRWAGNDRLLIGYGVKRGHGRDLLFFPRMLVFDLVQNAVRSLARQNEDVEAEDVVHVADDGSHVLLSVARGLSYFPAVYRVDLATGDMKKVVPEQLPIVSWRADSNGVVRLGVGYMDRRLKLIYRAKEDGDFETLARVKFDDIFSAIGAIAWSSGDKGFLVSNARTGRYALYEIDSKTFNLDRPVYEHPDVDIDGFKMKKDGSGVEAVYYTEDRERTLWLDPEMQSLQTEVDDALKGRINAIADANLDRTKFLVWTSTPEDPGHYYFYYRPTGVMQRLATVHETLKDKRLAPMTPVSYAARDGLRIPAYLTLPVGRKLRGLPVIVMPHGGPFDRDRAGYDPWVQFLANRGYAVLQANFRGSAGYGREFLSKGFGQWGTGMLDDVDDGLQWLVKEGIADPKRACTMGASYGGYAAMMLAIRSPERYRCAISFAGVTDVRGMLLYDHRYLLPSPFYLSFRDKVLGEGRGDADQISPAHRARELAVPLLFAHGTEDTRVPYEQAELMVDALKRAGKSFEFLRMEDVQHGFDKDADHAKFLAAVDEFLAKHNPAD